MHYNVVAKKLDRRVAALGGQHVINLGLGDDQHPSGYEAALDPWLAQLWSALHAQHLLHNGTAQVVNPRESHRQSACHLLQELSSNNGCRQEAHWPICRRG